MLSLVEHVKSFNNLGPGFLMTGLILHFLILSFADLSGIPSECQTVWIQIKSDKLLGLIWVQTVCKSYQMTLGGRVS